MQQWWTSIDGGALGTDFGSAGKALIWSPGIGHNDAGRV
jgi:hypothetical protein